MDSDGGLIGQLNGFLFVLYADGGGMANLECFLDVLGGKAGFTDGAIADNKDFDPVISHGKEF